MDSLYARYVSEYTGDDLCKVLELLNVKCSPNYVRGLFDTDDRNMNNLLSWLCSSLSCDNYIPPLEEKFFDSLENNLTGQRYQETVQQVEHSYPGIFDLEGNILDSELLQDELNMLCEEEIHLDKLLLQQESLHTNLTKELNAQTTLEIGSEAKLKSAQEHSNRLADELDTLHEKIHSQVVKYAKHLHDFEYSSVPYFLNNLDVMDLEDKFNNLKVSLGPIIDAPLISKNSNMSISRNVLSFNMTNSSETENSDLLILKDRISSSKLNYLMSLVEVDMYKEILNYLNQCTVEEVIYLTESEDCQYIREKRLVERNAMSAILNKIATKFANEVIADAKLKYPQKELEVVQSKFDIISQIFDAYIKLLSLYVCLSIMYQQEQKDIISSDNFFRQIRKEPVESFRRIQKMTKIIEDYTANIEENKLKLVKTISEMLTGEECDMDKAFATVVDFRSRLKEVEEKVFNIDFIKHRSILKDMVSNVKTLQKFLISGPTHRIVLIPADLHYLIRDVEQMLKKQKQAVKSALEICKTYRNSTNQWQNYHRQLWMFFYSDPQKIDFILEKIENEYTKSKMKKDLSF